MANCYGPGAEGGWEPGVHWAEEPYYGTNYRYVWVVDWTGPGVNRDSLQQAVNLINGWAAEHGPYFYYVTAEDLGYGTMMGTGCTGDSPYLHAQQVVEVCDSPNSGGQGYGTYTDFPSVRHLQWGKAVAIADRAGQSHDPYQHNAVLHEFGHAALGLAHNSRCDSMMTYCSSFSERYLWLDPVDDTRVYYGDYVYHPRG